MKMEAAFRDPGERNAEKTKQNRSDQRAKEPRSIKRKQTTSIPG